MGRSSNCRVLSVDERRPAAERSSSFSFVCDAVQTTYFRGKPSLRFRLLQQSMGRDCILLFQEFQSDGPEEMDLSVLCRCEVRNPCPETPPGSNGNKKI